MRAWETPNTESVWLEREEPQTREEQPTKGGLCMSTVSLGLKSDQYRPTRGTTQYFHFQILTDNKYQCHWSEPKAMDAMECG